MNKLHSRQPITSISYSPRQPHNTLRFLLLFVVVQLTACGDSEQLKPLAKDAVIVAFGDSLTYGTGVHIETESYPAYLEQLSGIKVINAGVPGEVSREGRQRLKNVLEKHQPDLVILCHGGNDILRKLSKTELEANLQAMIADIRLSGAQVVMLAVPNLGFMAKPEPVYKQVAEQQKVVLENHIIATLETKSELKSDPIHLNEAGNRQLAETILALLQDRGAL